MAITRSFTNYVPLIYIQLPYEYRTIDELSTFKKKLNTYSFKKAYIMEILFCNLLTKSNFALI